MRIITYTSLITILLISTFSAVAQKKYKEIRLHEIHGTAIGNDNESPKQVAQKAINDAKIKALKQAGIEENITSYTDFFQSENNNNYDELFSTDILTDIRGAVKNVEIVDTKSDFNDFGKIQVDVVINCTVIKYFTGKDLSFDVWVDGVGLFYQNETNLVFAIKPSQNAYVNMFIINETEAFQLFPNNLEKPFLLQIDHEYKFPTYLADYVLTTNKKSEAHRLIMVFTKENIPYTGEIKYKPIIDWIFSIPPDMRVIKSFSFHVVQEEKITED